MLWSGNNDFICIAIADGQHPGTPALPENSSCQSMEAAMWHSLLDGGITDNVHPVTDFKFLDDAGDGRKSAFSEILLEFISCFLSWSIVMCHCLISLLCSFYLHDIEAEYVRRSVQDLG
jgi:hypothetical protein